MKVFISWSKKRSRAVADALRDWLPLVLQSVKPWTSAGDIDIGARWNTQINKTLESTRFGIVCLTRENYRSPWILFESGAMAKTMKKTFVCPYLLDLGIPKLEGPLAQFQGATADKDGTFMLVSSINQALRNKRLPRNRLKESFDCWWPRLEAEIEKARASADISEGQCPTAEEMRVEGIYENRDAALERFRAFIDFELDQPCSDQSPRIWFICSSLKGFTMTPRGAKFDGSKVLDRIASSKCQVRFLMTDPQVADMRAKQENRKPGDIPNEIWETVRELKKRGIDREAIRFYDGTPTVFAIATTQAMLLNPYPYQQRSHQCFSMIVHKSSSIYDQYYRAHFESPWEERYKEVPPDEW